MNIRILRALVALAIVGGTRSSVPSSPLHSAAPAPDRILPNDNRKAAGIVRGGVLELRLEARVATWHPDGDAAPGTPMPAFAEEGKSARIPGPLVRVPAGTEAEISVHNTLRDTLLVHGLHERSAAMSGTPLPIAVAPGERRSVRFRLHAAGTYFYWGTTMRRAIGFRTLEDAQLTGAIVVDDATARPTPDRVFVIGMWTDTVHRAMTHRQRVLAVINGRSWPNTERLQQTVGDTVRWRVINASADLHPMHLHGFYFRIDGRGDGVRDTAYTPAAAGLAVTENMFAGSTRNLLWVPERAGNWLFHCHIPEHFGRRGALGMKRQSSTPTADAMSHANHANTGMSGMVLGIEVRESRGASARGASARSANATVPPALNASGQTPVAQKARAAGAGTDARIERVMRLLVRPNRGSSNAVPFYGYSFHENGVEPTPDSGLGYGPTLDLVRGQPVRITVVNRLPEATAVHWHGIELESYYDGVPGFSGASRRLSPMVQPGDSFQVRFTPPRAGTFIYHTHAEEERQQLAGLAGVLVVNEPGVSRNAAIDIPILLSAPTDLADQGRRALVNGTSEPRTQIMQLGTTYRLRLVQMSTLRAALRVELFRDSSFSTWSTVAKDGADLPTATRALQPSRVQLGIGETLDVEIKPTTVGAMRLEIRVGQPWPAPSVLLATLPIAVISGGR